MAGLGGEIEGKRRVIIVDLLTLRPVACDMRWVRRNINSGTCAMKGLALPETKKGSEGVDTAFCLLVISKPAKAGLEMFSTTMKTSTNKGVAS